MPWFCPCDKDPKPTGTPCPAEPAATVTARWGQGCPKVLANPVPSACWRGQQELLILPWLLPVLVLPWLPLFPVVGRCPFLCEMGTFHPKHDPAAHL